MNTPVNPVRRARALPAALLALGASACSFASAAGEPRPLNDDFAAAGVLSGRSVRVAASTLNATLETDEPRLFGAHSGRSVWYAWTAPSSRRFQFSAFSEAFDPTISVYIGSSLGQLVPVDYNNDASPAVNGIAVTSSLATIEAVAGKTYLISVDAYDGRAGDFVLTLVDSDWQFPTGFAVAAPPSVAPDGTVYVGGADFYLYALRRDGSAKWSFPTGGPIEGGAAVGDDGAVYFGSADGVVRALSSSGAPRWQYAAGGGAAGAPALAADGTVYFTAGWFHALNANGTLRWRDPVGTGTHAAPVVGADGASYVGGDFPAVSSSANASLYAYDAAGVSKWKRPFLNYDKAGSLAIDGQGGVYAATFDGRIDAANPDGTRKWERRIAAAPFPLSNEARPPASPPALGDGVLYAGCYDGGLSALNLSDGSPRWRLQLGAAVYGSGPAIAADGSVLIGCDDGLLYHVNSDGTVRRTYATGGKIRSSPVIADGRIYVGSDDGRLHAFALALGAASTDWPMALGNARRLGRRIAAAANPTVGGPSLAPSLGGRRLGDTLTFSATATGGTGLSYQWNRNGAAIAGATAGTYQKANFRPGDAGLYTVTVRNAEGGLTTSAPTLAAPLPPAQKFSGDAVLVAENVRHANGNTYDQLLLTGPAATFSADPGQTTRLSFLDEDDDIVQVEFSGGGGVTVALDVPAGAAPQPATKYEQPGVAYMKGRARIYLAGVESDTYLSVFTVGRANSVNQGLFKTGVVYDGIADLGLIAIDAVFSGRETMLGGIFAGNAVFSDTAGHTGLYAPGVRAIAVPVRIGDINAFDNATPVLVTGPLAGAWIAGGSLAQQNRRALQIGGVAKISMRSGATSHGVVLPAQNNAGRVERDGVDVTAAVVENPSIAQ